MVTFGVNEVMLGLTEMLGLFRWLRCLWYCLYCCRDAPDTVCEDRLGTGGVARFRIMEGEGDM